MTLRQYEPKAATNLRKSALIDKFIQLNMPRADGVRDDGPCLAIVPYVDKTSADFPGQLVDFDDNKRKMRKAKKKMIKGWLKGAKLIRRRLLSADVIAELKRSLRKDGGLMQWTVASLRDHVSSVVGISLKTGPALVFFHKKLQQLLPTKRKRWCLSAKNLRCP